MTDKHLDEAIDRAVREMVDVDAPADLKPRVLSELGTAVRIPMHLWPFGAAAAIAAAVLAAVLVMPRERDDAPVPAPVAQAPGPVPEAQEPPQAPAPQVADRRPRPVRVVTAATIVEYSSDSAIPPIAALDPLAVVPLESPRIAAPEVSISPLVPIDDVVVDALSAPRERE